VLKITFDSNVWRLVASPEVFPNDASRAAFQTIRAAIVSGKALALLAEPVFTLEAIKKADRRAFFAAYRLQVRVSERELPDGEARTSVSRGQNVARHPGNNPHLSQHLQDALGIGFKLTCTPRIGGLKNPDLQSDWFYSQADVDANGRNDRFSECSRAIEAMGCGITHIKDIGARFAAANETWFDGLCSAPSSEDASVARAVAEWADGDAVAAHYAYLGDYFCTRDTASAAGANSIMSSTNRLWAQQQYGIQFISPDDLATHVA